MNEMRLTYSAAIRSTSNNIIIQVKILVEYRGIQLSLAVKPISHSLPSGGRMRCLHLRFTSSYSYHKVVE